MLTFEFDFFRSMKEGMSPPVDVSEHYIKGISGNKEFIDVSKSEDSSAFLVSSPFGSFFVDDSYGKDAVSSLSVLMEAIESFCADSMCEPVEFNAVTLT